MGNSPIRLWQIKRVFAKNANPTHSQVVSAFFVQPKHYCAIWLMDGDAAFDGGTVKPRRDHFVFDAHFRKGAAHHPRNGGWAFPSRKFTDFPARRDTGRRLPLTLSRVRVLQKGLGVLL